MQLVSLHLRNIRSYVDTTIDFPSGTTLLSGDIGSGKSTILYSIEFALFGILRGMLSGDGLLRHGAKEGSVTLRFTLDGKEIIVMRSLRRGKDTVAQDAGSITIDGQLLPATAVEIKSRILEILGYPSDLLTKSKGLIFRYTVYTPQEEMKEILLGDAEARLGTLRKVFGMDRYKRIQDNSSILLRHLRDERKKLEGFLLDWEEKKQQHAALRLQQSQLEPRIAAALEKSSLCAAKLACAQQESASLQAKHIMFIQLKTQQEGIESQIRSIVSQQLSVQKELPSLQAQIIALEESLPVHDVALLESLKTKLTSIGTQMKQRRSEVLTLTSQQAMHQTHISTSRSLQEKIGTIQNCPTCLQIVGPEHKQTIASEQEHVIGAHQEHVNRIQQSISSYTEEIQQLESQQEEAMTQIHILEKAAIHNQNLIEYRQRLATLTTLSSELTTKNQQYLATLSQIREQMHGLEGVPALMAAVNEQIKILTSQERQAASEHQALVVTSSQIGDRIKALDADLLKRESAHAKVSSISKTSLWLEDYFGPLMGHIERHVLGTIHREFSSYFCNWFSLLIEDQHITARLDETFSPIVTQNGYDTSLEFLSGGEKTSCALAYRLALNKVINDVVSTIRTKDLLILDEPTDGFSSEQLDKVRDVLDELHLGQILIVSHEAKMESFAQSVIRVVKEEGESKVALL